jgi:hypothetical protein
MKIEQHSYTERTGWVPAGEEYVGNQAQVVLVFGETNVLRQTEHMVRIRTMYPRAQILGCSTAGEICGTQVFDDSIVTTAITFDSTTVRTVSAKIGGIGESFSVGERLARALDSVGLVHVFVLSDGLKVNGSALVKGLTENLPSGVSVTGGLSGDKARFEETLVICNGHPEPDLVAVLALYGERLRVGYGSMGGWDPFGPERVVTRSEANILYELDGKSALELYKTYLGEHAKGLPATALLFPLSIRVGQGGTKLVRTILSINEQDQSMIFAGDLPEGAYAQFMKANFNRLIDGAVGASKISHEGIGPREPELAVLISCVGRKMVLKQRVEEEVEGVKDALGSKTVMTGFYSYGEISPIAHGSPCELHNQTMTVTTFVEE